MCAEYRIDSGGEPMRRILVATAILFYGGLSAHGVSNEIKGFVFHSCEQNRCVEVKAGRAWISQADGSFVTDGLTVVSVLDGGRVRESFEGTDAVSQSSLDTVTLERSAGVVLINLKDGKTEVYGGGRP